MREVWDPSKALCGEDIPICRPLLSAKISLNKALPKSHLSSRLARTPSLSTTPFWCVYSTITTVWKKSLTSYPLIEKTTLQTLPPAVIHQHAFYPNNHNRRMKHEQVGRWHQEINWPSILPMNEWMNFSDIIYSLHTSPSYSYPRRPSLTHSSEHPARQIFTKPLLTYHYQSRKINRWEC